MGAYARAEAIGHDLHGPHHVTVAQWRGTAADDRFLGAVGRAAQGRGLRSLLARRGDMAVLVVRGEPRDSGLYQALADEVGSPYGAVGVGSLCEAVADIPRSFDQAVRALAVRRQSHPADGTTTCEELGLYRILARDKDAGDVSDFVREWLGALLDYDDAHGTDLVHTLTRYFDHGGNYDETAQALAVHRSTLRYRLQRIGEVSGHAARRGGQPLQPPGRHPDLEGQRPRLLTARLAPLTRLTRTGRDRPPLVVRSRARPARSR